MFNMNDALPLTLRYLALFWLLLRLVFPSLFYCLALRCCFALPYLALYWLVWPCVALPCLILTCLALRCLILIIALPCWWLVLPCLALPSMYLSRGRWWSLEWPLFNCYLTSIVVVNNCNQAFKKKNSSRTNTAKRNLH